MVGELFVELISKSNMWEYLEWNAERLLVYNIEVMRPKSESMDVS